MARGPSTRSLGNTLLVLLLGGVLVTQALQAMATHQPADKAAAAGEDVMKVPVGPTAGAGTVANDILGPVTVRNSKPTDLMLHVTLECSILTEVTSTNSTPNSSADGRIRVWLVIDGNIVPISSVSNPPQDPDDQAPGADIDKVTFCNRTHQLQQTDAENPLDGVDTTRSFIETKDANAFNWIRLNVGSGLHEISVRADLATQQAATGTSRASGFVGNRTLLVVPTKLANDATI